VFWQVLESYARRRHTKNLWSGRPSGQKPVQVTCTDEVAQAFLYLASDQASGVTGIDLRVDAGLTANLFILETLPEE